MPKLINFTGKLPRAVGVAVSGGVDSMAILHFLMQSKRDITVYHVNHGTEHATDAERFVRDWCDTHRLKLVVSEITEEKDKRQSLEEFWRIERYKFFHAQSLPVITAHHLDDCVETWLFTSFNGNPTWIPYQNRNVIRPFRISRKCELEEYANRKGVPFVQDHSNFENVHARNRIRNLILPEVLKVNPGIHTVLKKKINSETM